MVSEALDGNIASTREDFPMAEQEATRFISGMNLTCWHQLRCRAWEESGSGGAHPRTAFQPSLWDVAGVGD